MMHGSQKLLGAFGGSGIAGVTGMLSKLEVEPAHIWAWVLSITEFVGGICVVLGFLTRFWAVGLVIDMAVAIFKVHLMNGFFASKNGFELPLALGVMALGLVLTGPGSFSVDRATGIEKGGAG
jgi:putative oxidoreductase